MTLSCDEVRQRLDDYVDGEISEGELHEVELHLEGCAACRQEEGELRRLLALAAGLPRSVAPAHNLWPAIAAGIERRGRPGASWVWWIGAAAALAAVAFWFGPRFPEVRPAAGLSPAPGARGVDVVPVDLREMPVAEAEREYARATAELMAAIQARQGSLAPETLAHLEQNLKAIDDALAQIREALAKDASNAQLNRLLASTHEKKVETLQRVLRLASL